MHRNVAFGSRGKRKRRKQTLGRERTILNYRHSFGTTLPRALIRCGQLKEDEEGDKKDKQEIRMIMKMKRI